MTGQSEPTIRAMNCTGKSSERRKSGRPRWSWPSACVRTGEACRRRLSPGTDCGRGCRDQHRLAGLLASHLEVDESVDEAAAKLAEAECGRGMLDASRSGEFGLHGEKKTVNINLTVLNIRSIYHRYDLTIV